MGITSLWDVIKEQDHSVPIAQLAEDHFKQHGRPLRMAIDEPDWRFNNLTPQQVYLIREKSNEPAFQGIEKAMFYRICRLLTLNVQLLFVFDGPSKPWKRGRRGGGKIDYRERDLLKDLLRYFRIPYHEAPGEAEAECARLQRLGIVDAVFSQDSDTLMFGCSMLIRDDRVAKAKGSTDRSKENTKKSGATVRVVYGREIQAQHKLDRAGLVLFAMLAGGDYDTKGLAGCGSAMATRVVKAGLGTSLCLCKTQRDCTIWRELLVTCLQGQRGARIDVPLNFPSIEILDKYNRPKISTDQQLRNLRGLRNGWNAPIDELKLLETTSSRFNIWGRLYMNWVGPVLLTKFLVARDPSLPKEHVHQIKPTKQRARKNDAESTSLPLLRQLAFSPFSVTTLRREDFEGDRAGYWTGVAQDVFEPNYTVKTEIPLYLLEKVLPPEVLDPPLAQKKTPKTPRGRKRQAEDDDTSNSGMPTDITKRRRATPLSRSPMNNENRLSTPAGRSASCRPPQNAEFISLLSESEEDTLPSQRHSGVIDSEDSCFESEDEDEDLNRAIQLSLQESHIPTDLAWPSDRQRNVFVNSTSADRDVDGDVLFAGPSGPRTAAAATSSTSSLNTIPTPRRAVNRIISQRPDTQESSSITGSPSAHCAEIVSGIAEVRAARLQFFSSHICQQGVAPATKRPHVSARKQNDHANPQSTSDDIETIDLT